MSSLLSYQQIQSPRNSPRNAQSLLKRVVCVLIISSFLVLYYIHSVGMNDYPGMSSSSSSNNSVGVVSSLISAFKSNDTDEEEEEDMSLRNDEDDYYDAMEMDTLADEEHETKSDDTSTRDDPTQPYNTHNPHGKSWCPYATCHNSPVCQPCERRYLFILATARSGSTTLLRMLNSLPNVRLGGENLNTLFKAHEVIYNLHDEENHAPPIQDNGVGVPHGPMMHNPIPQGAYSCPTQLWIDTLNPPPEKIMHESHRGDRPSVEEFDQYKILGLKSVRFHLGNWTAVEAGRFLMNNFPCARVILNYRSNVESQYESIRSRFPTSTRTKEELEAYNNFQLDLASELGPEMAILLDMNEWKDNTEVINHVVDWLGFKNCHFQELVHENHDGYQRDAEHSLELSKKCWYPYKKVELERKSD